MMNPYLTGELNKERQRELMARAARRAVLRGGDFADRRRPLRILGRMAWRSPSVSVRPAVQAPAEVVTIAGRTSCAEQLAS